MWVWMAPGPYMLEELMLYFTNFLKHEGNPGCKHGLNNIGPMSYHRCQHGTNINVDSVSYAGREPPPPSSLQSLFGIETHILLL